MPLYRICLAQKWKPTECIESFAWALISVVARDQKKGRKRKRKREKEWTIGCAYMCTRTRIISCVPKSLHRIATHHVTSRYVHAWRWLIFVSVILFCNRAESSRSERAKESAEVSRVQENHSFRVISFASVGPRISFVRLKYSPFSEQHARRETNSVTLPFHLPFFSYFLLFYGVIINFQKARWNEMRLASNIPTIYYNNIYIFFIYYIIYIYIYIHNIIYLKNIYIYPCLHDLTNAWIAEAKRQRGIHPLLRSSNWESITRVYLNSGLFTTQSKQELLRQLSEIILHNDPHQ